VNIWWVINSNSFHFADAIKSIESTEITLSRIPNQQLIAGTAITQLIHSMATKQYLCTIHDTQHEQAHFLSN